MLCFSHYSISCKIHSIHMGHNMGKTQQAVNTVSFTHILVKVQVKCKSISSNFKVLLMKILGYDVCLSLLFANVNNV